MPMPEPTVWVVDDDHAVRFVLATALREAGLAVQAFADAAQAREALAQASPALVVTDVRMPGDSGLALLRELKAAHPALPVVVMSAHTDVASTSDAFRGGAQEFLSKPFDLDAAVALVRRLLPAPDAGAEDVQDDAHDIAAERATATDAAAMLGDSAAMAAVFRAIGRIAQAPLGVLVTGETGTGKELVARALHRESPRAAGPFVAVNTAAIPAELLESELFGHEAGAFTGAQRRHAGRFEQADGGSLFLDEIGDMPAALQTRLLRVLSQGEFFRVGGRELVRVDVRVIAATHQPLQALVAEGRFRADLLHRLDVLRIALPPLRERRGDIALLATHFLQAASQRLQLPARRLSPAALERLRAHAWPGNVRELENVCWRLATLAADAVVTAADVDAALAHAQPATNATDAAASWQQALSEWAQARLADGEQDLHASAREAFDRVLLQAALAHTGGHRGRAAALLGLGRNTLTRKLGASRGRTPG